MRAAQISEYGQNVVKTVDAPKPTLDQDRVMVEVHAAAINPFDVKLTTGFYGDSLNLKLPATLGSDVSGVIIELGGEVAGFAVGQEVFGMANGGGGQGSIAEFSAVKASQLSLKPETASFEEAAALPLTGVSAYQALVEHMDLQPGQKILIHGGAGGIGSLAIQIAKNIGAYVATTAAADDADFVCELGADEVIDYKNQDFSQVLHDYDAVFDTVGGESNAKSYEVLKSGGALVSMLEPGNEQLIEEKSIHYTQQQTVATAERLAKVAALVDSGKLKVHVDKVFSLDQAAEAFEYSLSGHPRGKVVVRVSD
jgi:alcohol dehydrogenase